MNKSLSILFICQIIYWCIVIIGISLASIVGSQLASSAILATLPLAILTIGNILSTLPLSLIMQRFSRRLGFSLGSAASLIGGIICCYGIAAQSFWLFCLGNATLGIAQASALYYRLAATDSVSPEKQGRAIALVMSGGIVAALIAPTLANWSQTLFLPQLFLGSYLVVTILSLVSLILCLQLPVLSIKQTLKDKGRAIKQIIKQPIFIVAITNTAIGHAIMVLIMIATPLAMLSCGHSVGDAAYVIQWHVLGMFIPSFFSGKLIDRFGASTISLLGACVLAISILISLSGIELINFYSGLFLLGLGWNFMYTSGSTLIARSHQAEERGKTQGAAELIIACLASLAAFSSGVLLHQFGWSDVNIGSIPLLIIAVVVTLWFRKVESKSLGFKNS